jgi:hypothetical protein
MKHNETYETYGNSGLAKFNRNRVSCRWLWSIMLLFGFLGTLGWSVWRDSNLVPRDDLVGLVKHAPPLVGCTPAISGAAQESCLHLPNFLPVNPYMSSTP